jgi:5-methylcytosine-specific restriction endonuclease McrA
MNTLLAKLLQYVLPRKYWYRKVYLRSNHWREIRRQKLREVGYKCANHDMVVDRLDVHHLHYYDGFGSILFREKMDNLQVLCRTCHKEAHKKG